MRILHWLNAFLPEMGGIQTLCADLVPEQLDRGHEVMLLASQGREAMPDRSVHGRIEVCRIDWARAILERDPGRVLRARIRTERFLDEFDPDVLHIHPCGPETLQFVQVDRRRHRPTVVTVHNNYSSAGIELSADSSFGATLSAAERIASVSDEARRWVIGCRPDLLASVSTVANGVPIGTAAATPLPWDPPRITYIGRINAIKRLDVLIDAFALLAKGHPELLLSIAGPGDPELVGAIAARIERLGLAARVELLGRIEPAEVPGLLARTTLHVLSSDREGLPMVLLEAGRQGRPSVVTDVGGCGELIIDGETGSLVAPGDPRAFAAAIDRLLREPERAARLGAAAAERVRTRYSLDACADAYERLYAEAVSAVETTPGGLAR